MFSSLQASLDNVLFFAGIVPCKDVFADFRGACKIPGWFSTFALAKANPLTETNAGQRAESGVQPAAALLPPVPSDYAGNQSCWLVLKASQPDKQVAITFENFDLPPSAPNFISNPSQPRQPIPTLVQSIAQVNASNMLPPNYGHDGKKCTVARNYPYCQPMFNGGSAGDGHSADPFLSLEDLFRGEILPFLNNEQARVSRRAHGDHSKPGNFPMNSNARTGLPVSAFLMAPSSFHAGYPFPGFIRSQEGNGWQGPLSSYSTYHGNSPVGPFIQAPNDAIMHFSSGDSPPRGGFSGTFRSTEACSDFKSGQYGSGMAISDGVNGEPLGPAGYNQKVSQSDFPIQCGKSLPWSCNLETAFAAVDPNVKDGVFNSGVLAQGQSCVMAIGAENKSSVELKFDHFALPCDVGFVAIIEVRPFPQSLSHEPKLTFPPFVTASS